MARFGERASRESVLIDKSKCSGGAHLDHLAQAEAEQDTLFDPGIGFPATVDLFCGANIATSQRLSEFKKELKGARVFAGVGAERKQPFDIGLEWMHFGAVYRTQGLVPEGFKVHLKNRELAATTSRTDLAGSRTP